MPGDNTLRILCTGQQGMGKTAWARELIRRTMASGRRLVALSTKPADYVDLVGPSRTLRCQEPASGYSVAQLERPIDRKGSKTFYVFERFTDRSSRPEFMGRVAAACEQVGNLVLVVDEAHQFLPRYRTAPGTIGLLTAARAAGVDVVLITQHPRLLDDLAAKESNTWVLFGSPDPNESRYLSQLSGVDQALIQRLQPGQYVLRYSYYPPGETRIHTMDLAAEYGRNGA